MALSDIKVSVNGVANAWLGNVKLGVQTQVGQTRIIPTYAALGGAVGLALKNKKLALLLGAAGFLMQNSVWLKQKINGKGA